MIANDLKKIRMQKFLMNKKEFAKLLGIAEQQYLRYENGLGVPSLETCLKIAATLGCTVNEIWFFSESH